MASVEPTRVPRVAHTVGDLWWGTGASAVQAEGASPADDWFAWEQAGHAPVSGDGNGFAHRYREDLTLLAEWGFSDHRMSINWARIEPEAGRYDQAAIDYYRSVLAAGGATNLRMWVTLLHTAQPVWFADEGGFAGPTGADRWARWVDFAAETFGDLVGGWMPFNNPTSFAQKAYHGGKFPPGRASANEFVEVLGAVHRADFEGALRLRETGRPVCSNESLAPLYSADDSAEAKAAIDGLDGLVWNSWLALARSERYAGAFDFYGFSYYSAAQVTGQGALMPYPTGAELGPLGYAPWPGGLAAVLDRLNLELPGKRFVVAELGYGGGDDHARIEYLIEALEHIQQARNAGTDVAGVFFWTGIDNYEWLHGNSVPFGLFDADRQPRGSAGVIREVIRGR